MNISNNNIKENLYELCGNNNIYLEYLNEENCMKSLNYLINVLFNINKQKYKLLEDYDYLGKYKIESLVINKYMKLDAVAIKALNLLPENDKSKCIRSIYDVLNHTYTKCIGERLLKQWIRQPLKEKEEILKRQNLVTLFLENKELRENIIDSCLKGCPDLTSLSRKIERGNNIKIQDLYSLYSFCSKLKILKSLINNYEGDNKKLLEDTFLKDIINVSNNLKEYEELFEENIDMDSLNQPEPEYLNKYIQIFIKS